MRLIDADTLIESMGLENAVKLGNKDGYQQDHSYGTLMRYEIKGEIDAQQTVEAVPIRRTKPVMGVSRDQMRNWWQCGNCESVIDQGDRYCRGCGAEVEWDGHT